MSRNWDAKLNAMKCDSRMHHLAQSSGGLSPAMVMLLEHD